MKVAGMHQKILLWYLTFILIWSKILAQDAGDIVNALNVHSDECKAHDWQVVDVGGKCGTKPACSFPKTWCSSDNGALSCVPLTPKCQMVVQADLGTTTTATSTKTSTAKTTSATSKASTRTTTRAASTTRTTTTTTPRTPAVDESFGTLPPFIAASTRGVPVRPTDPSLRPLPVGPDGQLLVYFKVVGNQRPNCPDNSNFCCAWARSNECNDNAFFMQTYCRRSCQELRRGGPDAVGRPLKPGELITIGGDQLTIGENAFGDPPGGTCQDLHPKCRLWAGRGECKRNSLYMVSICRPACGLCPPCVQKCQTVCPAGGYSESLYGGGGGCQQKCSGCGR